MLKICVATTAARCSKYDEREVCGAALYTTYLRTYTAATYYTRQYIYIYNFYIKRHITVTKLLLAIAASLDLDMVKFDVKEAYLTTRVKANNKYYARRPPGTRNNEMAYIMEPECFIYGHPLANKEFRDLLFIIKFFLP